MNFFLLLTSSMLGMSSFSPQLLSSSCLLSGSPGELEVSLAHLQKAASEFAHLEALFQTGDHLLFYLFSSLAILSGTMVIRARNPVHSVLFLIFVFCNVAGLLILLGLDFFAMVFLVVYVGAIAVLFLFVVMMLNIKLVEINENLLRYLPIGGLIGMIFLFEIFFIVDSDLIPILHFGAPSSSAPLAQESFYLQWPQLMNQVSNIQAVGQLIYTYFFYYFLMASLVLLVAMIGAILLTMHKGVDVKRQEVFEQNTREFTKTIQKLEVSRKRGPLALPSFR
jgi:NADH-ubiquinone oxidoreductase chain 6